MNVMIEALGSPVWGATLPFLRQVADKVVGLDIDPYSFGLYMVDKPYLVPRYAEPGCFDRLIEICRTEQVRVVFPSINEGLVAWAQRRDELAREGIHVIISPPETIRWCVDKWETYQFFVRHGVPTPGTSLEQKYSLLKPRQGRGGKGIRLLDPGEEVNMTGCVTQEYLEGQEFSVDALCSLEGEVLYVVPRKRMSVESGLSITGEVVVDEEIVGLAQLILGASLFVGPLNMQCFRTREGIFFTEINPRLAGGMSLSMAATENWFNALKCMLVGKKVEPVLIKNGLIMMRYYSDCIVDRDDLLS